ncbi:hypothetical protein GCM10027347_59100 [Larkinella harenae]
MVATQTKIRRGTAAQIDSMTPADGEVVYDQTNDRLRVGDGVKQGGWHQASATDIQHGRLNTGVAVGAANALTLTLSPALSELNDGTTVRIKASADNTGSASLDVNGLGAETIQKFTGTSLANLSGGEIVTGNYYTLIFNGSVWVMQGGVGGGASGVVTTVFTSNGTWTKPANLVSLVVEVQAPGQNANRVQLVNQGSGGGYAKKTYQASDLSASENVVLPLPNWTSVTASFKGISCKNDGTATGGDINIPARGGNSFMGWSGDNAININATGYGGGGASNSQTFQNGVGSNGIIILTEYRS